MYDHPKYKKLPSGELKFDFALLKTSKSMGPFDELLRPICLPPRSRARNNFFSF